MITYILYNLVNLYIMIIFVYVILSWFQGIRFADTLRDILGKVCEPYLGLFRRLIPPLGGMVDVTPIIAVVVLELAVQAIVRLLSLI